MSFNNDETTAKHEKRSMKDRLGPKKRHVEENEILIPPPPMSSKKVSREKRQRARSGDVISFSDCGSTDDSDSEDDCYSSSYSDNKKRDRSLSSKPRDRRQRVVRKKAFVTHIAKKQRVVKHFTPSQTSKTHDMIWKPPRMQLSAEFSKGGMRNNAIAPACLDSGADVCTGSVKFMQSMLDTGITLHEPTEKELGQVATPTDVVGIVYGDITVRTPNGEEKVWPDMQVIILKEGDEFLISRFMLKEMGCDPLEDFLKSVKEGTKLKGNATREAMEEMGQRKH